VIGYLRCHSCANDTNSLAEYLRVPFAETTCVLLPAGAAHELDYLLISDIWPTAWFALDCANFQAGDSVAVFGAGPVGLLCAYSAILRGASAVYSIDHVPARLEKAKSKGDPVTQILKHEPLGVARSCDCVGFECVDEKLKPREGEVVNNCIRVTAASGGIGLIGVYIPNTGKTLGAPKATTKDNNVEFPIAEFWLKGLSMQGGIAEVRRYHATLIDLIERGKATPSFVISSEIGIEDAPDGYRRFSEHKETKVVLRFPWLEKEVKANGHRTKRVKYSPDNRDEAVTL
jgi:threonine dehydrogenase-like Zn-dependent dehydrogenase